MINSSCPDASLSKILKRNRENRFLIMTAARGRYNYVRLLHLIGIFSQINQGKIEAAKQSISELYQVE